MSKTLKYLPEGENFSDHHFSRAEVFRKTSPFCEGGMAKRYATGGKIQSRKAPPASPPPPKDWGEGQVDQQTMDRVRKTLDSGADAKMRAVDSARAALSTGEQTDADRAAAQSAAEREGVALPNGGFAKGGKVKRYARGGALSMQQPMAAPTPAAAPAMGGNPISDMMNGPLAGMGAQMQPGSPLHKAVTKIGQDAAKKIVKHIAGSAKGGKGTHGGKRAPQPVRRAEGGPVTSYAEGGDVAQDRGMVKSGVRQHETNMHEGKSPTPLKLATGGGISGLAMNSQPQDSRARVTRHGGTPGGEVPYGVQPSHESGNAPITTLRRGGRV